MREIQALQALIPPATLEMCRSRGAPVSLERLGIALPMFFRLAEPAELAKCCDADGGLAERLVASARESASPGELLKRASAKHLTSARIRRAAIFALLGTTYAELEEEPPYTLVLAANTRGSALLRELKKRSAVPVITKPADYRLHNAAVTTAFERSLRADGVYQLASGCGDSLKMTPYIK